MTSRVIKTSQYKNIPDAPSFYGFGGHPEKAADEKTKESVLDAAYVSAKQIVDAANEYSLKKIKETREKLLDESLKIRKQSYEEGFSEGMSEGKKAGMDAGYLSGYEEGLKACKEDNKKVAEELFRMLNIIEKSKSCILQKHEENIDRLALAIAEKVIKKELSLDKKTMLGMIKSATDSYRNQAWVHINVSENTANAFLQADKEIISSLAAVSQNVKIVVNPDLSDTDCLVELPDHIIDAGADTQLNKIKSAFDTVLY